MTVESVKNIFVLSRRRKRCGGIPSHVLLLTFLWGTCCQKSTIHSFIINTPPPSSSTISCHTNARYFIDNDNNNPRVCQPQYRGRPSSIDSRQQQNLFRLNMKGDGGGGGGEVFFIIMSDDDDDDNEKTKEGEEEEEEEEGEEDPYMKVAASEFQDQNKDGSLALASSSSSPSSTLASSSPSTNIDWGGALGTLRKRVDDIESGKSGKPSQALFRLMSAEAPNQMIGNFINSANPQVVQAMSGAVDALLGGLSNPSTGIETIVKATGEKIGSLCFQLQMTGYMFRNAEYVMALKKIMQIRGETTLQEYKDAFDRLDTDRSGFIEVGEVVELLNSVYRDKAAPDFEIAAFMKFFDKNADGKISWEEFERGLGAVFVQRAEATSNLHLLSGSAADEDDDDDDDDHVGTSFEPELTGTIEIELESGKVVEVDAKDYMKSLKDEAKMLKETLRKNGKRSQPSGKVVASPDADFGSITGYIASRQGDVKSLTEGISPEIVETMKMLVDYVLEGGENARAKKVPKEQMELEIPGSALQQLALWQLVLGYRLRENEAKGDYLRLLK